MADLRELFAAAGLPLAEDVMEKLEKYRALLLEWNRAGNTVVLITHDPKIGAACSRQVYMRDGRLSADPG